MKQPETYISIDVETAGPCPGDYAMLSIGACLVDDPARTFYIELQPVTNNALPEALHISGLTLEHLHAHGALPVEAMLQFEAWVQDVTPQRHRPVFVAFNAPFDWMFVCEYFNHFLGRNPFGHSGPASRNRAADRTLRTPDQLGGPGQSQAPNLFWGQRPGLEPVHIILVMGEIKLGFL